MEDRVVFITGAARGQGRAHAVRLAEEGADIIALDLCAQIDSAPYPLASEADLAETVRLVEATGRRIVAWQGDVRSRADQQAAVDAGLAKFGRLDVAIANAGILPTASEGVSDEEGWGDSIDVMLTGAWLTIKVAALPMIEAGRGGSIVLTSSTAGLRGVTDGSGGLDGYGAAKHGVVGLMRMYANLLARHSIRVNSIHPNAVETPMIMNEPVMKSVEDVSYPPNALPVTLIGAEDISNAVAWLVSDEAQFVTGVELPVDAGFNVNTINSGADVGVAAD